MPIEAYRQYYAYKRRSSHYKKYVSIAYNFAWKNRALEYINSQIKALINAIGVLLRPNPYGVGYRDLISFISLNNNDYSNMER